MTFTLNAAMLQPIVALLAGIHGRSHGGRPDSLYSPPKRLISSTQPVQIDLDARRHGDDAGDREMRIALLPFFA